MHEQELKSVVNKKFKAAKSQSNNISRDKLIVNEPSHVNQVQGLKYLTPYEFENKQKIIAA